MDKVKAVFGAIWGFLKFVAKWLVNLMLRYPLATAVTVILVAVAVVALTSGKTLQIGGLLGKIWGKKPKPSVRGVPPKERKDEGGEPIQPGEPDEKGWVQAPVSTEIVEPGIFSDPGKIEVVHPEKGTVTVELPEGVKNEDVREVVEIEPDIYEVRNRDKGKTTEELDDLLGKLK